MATYSYANIELPEAKRYFDLTGIENDLQSCSYYCEKYINVMEHIASPDPLTDREHLECIATFAFVKYGRCFKGGVRSSTEKELSQQIAEKDLELHKHALDIRDKHISHSINEFENHRLRVWLNPKERGRKVNNVNIESHRLVAPSPEFFTRLTALIETHLTWIKTEQKKESAALKELVTERYTLDELYKLSPETPPEMEMKNVGKARKML